MAEYLRRRLISVSPTPPRVLAEPFCGGAGAAVNLLADGDVDKIILNDADLRIYSAWYAILNEPERFKREIMACRLNMTEWYRHRNRLDGVTDTEYNFDLGFSTFYLNRTTRSGIVAGSGPIGGYSQRGRWKIDARFNKDRLALQVTWLADRRNDITLSNKDALSFLDQTRREQDCHNIYFFIDPPYVKAGGRLYLDGMSEAKHVALSDLLSSGKYPYWSLTYDDAPLIRDLYATKKCSLISVNYSLQSKRKEAEILVESTESV